MEKLREKYVRSFYLHPKLGALLPLADNDPLIYEEGPILVIDAKHRSRRMLFNSLKDWDDAFRFYGELEYKNTHKDTLATKKRKSYRLAYYEWKPDPKLASIPLLKGYPKEK